SFGAAPLRRIARLPMISRSLIAHLFFGLALRPDGRHLPVDDQNFTVLPTASSYRQFKPKILSGRLPDPASTNEVAVGAGVVDLPGIHVGSRLRIRMARRGIDPFSIDLDHAP